MLLHPDFKKIGTDLLFSFFCSHKIGKNLKDYLFSADAQSGLLRRPNGVLPPSYLADFDPRYSLPYVLSAFGLKDGNTSLRSNLDSRYFPFISTETSLDLNTLEAVTGFRTGSGSNLLSLPSASINDWIMVQLFKSFSRENPLLEKAYSSYLIQATRFDSGHLKSFRTLYQRSLQTAPEFRDYFIGETLDRFTATPELWRSQVCPVLNKLI